MTMENIEEFRTNLRAKLSVAHVHDLVTITQISRAGCEIRMPDFVQRQQMAELCLPHDDGFYLPIKAKVDTCTHKQKEGNGYAIKLKFEGSVNLSQGLVQLLEILAREKSREEQATTPKTDGNNSLTTVNVTCHMCGEKHIPFRMLQKKSMLSKINVFGAPSYTDALPGKDFCDFNLLRVCVCPSCYFASSTIRDFIKEKSTVAAFPIFDREPLEKPWKAELELRAKLITTDKEGFFTEDRNFEQALCTYDLALASCDFRYRIEQEKDKRIQNHRLMQKSVVYIMIKAEMLMTKQRKEEAETLLKTAMPRLENSFPYLEDEDSIKAAHLLSMLCLYFEEYKKFAKLYQFLKEYNKDKHLKEGADAYRTLNVSLTQIKDAYQNREDFSRKNLKGLEKPF